MLVCSGSAVTGCMTARKRPVKLTEADITRPDPADVDTMTSEHTPSSCPVGFDNLNSNSLSTFPRKQLYKDGKSMIKPKSKHLIVAKLKY